MESNIRIGHGYDVHRLVLDRALTIGGVTIPYERGLLGHSDADVVLHAVMDAILGALSLGDIGYHFPDTDPAYAGASSVTLLEKVEDMMKTRGYHIGNVDVTIIAQRPKLRPYIQDMQQNIATALQCDTEQINVKATTEEGLGFTGSGDGIATHAVCILIK